MGRVIEIVSRLGMILQPIGILGSVIPDHISQGQEPELLFHSIGHLVDLHMLIVDGGAGFEEIRGKGKLVVDTVGGIAVTAMIQGCKVNHVVPFIFNDAEKVWPIFEWTEPFAGDGLNCQASEG